MFCSKLTSSTVLPIFFERVPYATSNQPAEDIPTRLDRQGHSALNIQYSINVYVKERERELVYGVSRTFLLHVTNLAQN